MSHEIQILCKFQKIKLFFLRIAFYKEIDSWQVRDGDVGTEQESF